MEIKSVIIQVRPPSGRPGDYGICDIGHYFLEGDAIVMVDEDNKRISKPIRLDGRQPDDVARKYLRDRNTKADSAGFHRPILR